VEGAGFSTRLPLLRTGPDGPFLLEDRPDGSFSFEFRYVSPGLFRALGTPLVAGRHFEWNDHHGTQQIAVVSETLAQREWGSPAGALGKRIRRSTNSPWLEIVGVVGDVRHDGVERPAPDAVYLTSSEGLAQFASRTAFLFIRSERVGTAGFLDEVQRVIWSVNGSLSLGSAQTLGDVYQQSLARTSLTLVLLAITGAMALLLGLVGIYGVIGYALSQRTREIGIRMALGAQNAALKRMFVTQGLLVVVVGVVLGIGAAAALTRLMQSLLFGVTTLDPATYMTVTVILVLTAALASYLPIRRVTRVDPVRALRAE
jgi:predicted permease